MRALGVVLVVAACLGFLTVADDLRHSGELFGVGAVGLAGAALLLAGTRFAARRRVAPVWLAAGAGIGLALGAASGHMPGAVASGAALGALATVILGSRSGVPRA